MHFYKLIPCSHQLQGRVWHEAKHRNLWILPDAWDTDVIFYWESSHNNFLLVTKTCILIWAPEPQPPGASVSLSKGSSILLACICWIWILDLMNALTHVQIATRHIILYATSCCIQLCQLYMMREREDGREKRNNGLNKKRRQKGKGINSPIMIWSLFEEWS